MIITILMLIVSVYIIWRTTDAFDTAANVIGRNLSGGVRGATLNAAGSSMPELITLVLGILLFNDREGVAVGIGTIAGSAIYNIAVIPALAIIFARLFANARNIRIATKPTLRDTGWLVCIQVLFIALLAWQMMDLIGGIILAVLYVLYVGFLLLGQRSSGEGKLPLPSGGAQVSRLSALVKLDITPALLGHEKPSSSKQAWLLLLVSIMGIGLACWVLVEAVYNLGAFWQIQPYFVAVIIAAAATSIPDTILSVNDAMRGQYEDAISNAVGSNIFNISFGIGFPVLMVAIFMGASSNLDAKTLSEVVSLLMLLVPIYLAIGWILARQTLNLPQAALLIAIYFGYVGFIVAQALGMIDPILSL